MTSRRPMTRSFSGNGKTGGEEENGSSNSRSESRNPYLSNVRPENSYSRYSHYRPTRSTLCSVMAQLTEDIQPSYETTLKSKAVSENCNVKFSCVVSGYPEPELTWYKDDMEMDRYCGLPKYEIRRNGKTHSLHIFNCTLDDAAIYQASASNTKGIVSCSGVLEVGTMNEYKIHQRFFAKLKQKAENKRREMEESRKKGKENIQQQQQPENSPQRPQRKRLVPPQENPRPLQENPESTEKLQGTASEPNRVVADVKEEAPENGVETVETARILPEGCLATKKIKISSDLDGVSGSRSSTGSRGHLMGNGGENSYDGGMGLAQFLAETLSSQAAEEKQSSAREERAAEKDTSGPEVVKDVEMTKEGECEEAKEKEKQLAEACEREKQRVEQLAIERGRQSELPQNTGHAKHVSDTKSHSKGHKDHEHHHIQASISSVLHSVKDFFFGKSRKDPHEHKEKEYRDVSEPSTPSPGPTPPPRRPQLQTQRYSGERERLQLEKVEVPVEAVAAPQPPVSLEQFTPQEHKGEVGLLQTQDVPGEQLECAGSSSEPGAEEAMELSTELSTEVSMEVSMDVHSSDLGEATSMSRHQVLTKDEEEDLQTHSVPSTQQEPAVSLPVSGAEAQTSPPAGPPQSQAAHKDASSAASGFSSGESRSFVRTISETNSRGLGELPHETLHDKALHVDISGERYEHKVQENNSASDLGRQGKFEEKAEEPCEDNAMWSTPSAEEQIDVCDSTQTNQTPVTPLKEESEMESDDAESARLKEVDNTAPAQETNREFPATVSVERSENCDLEIQQESVTTAVESVQRADLRADQSSNITPKQNKDEGEKDDKVKASLNVKTEEQEQQRREVQSLTAQRGSGKEGESLVEVAESDELNSELKRLEEQSERGVVLPSEEQQQVASKPIGTDRHVSGFIEKDAPDTRADIPLILLNDHFMTANSGEPVEEADSRESDLPVRTLTLSDPKSEPPTSIDIAAGAVEVPLPDQRVAGGSPSMQSNVQADENLPLAHNVQEVAQHEDKTEMQKTEPVLQVDFESIPVISVSCMDEEEVCVPMPVSPLQTWQPDEAPTEPLPVVPPISISCNDCPPESHLPSPKHYTETESLLAAVLDKTVLLSDKTVELDKTQRGKHNPEAATLCTLANTSSVLSALTHTHVTSRVISSGETPDVSDVSVPETCNVKPLPADPPVEELHPDRPSAEWLEVRPSTLPPLSPSSLRRFLSRTAPGPDAQTTAGDTPGERAGEELSGGSTPTSSLSCESSPRLKRRDSLTLIRSATPEELASGARRKIFMTKAKGEDGEGAGVLDPQGKRESPYMSPGQARRALLQGTGQNTPPMERRSPLVSRRKAPPDVPKAMEEIRKDEPAGARTEEKEKDNLDPFKAPQVIRKIRGEPFPDATGHLKLWCQFFNVLSHSTVKWFRDDEEIVEVTKSGGDESQVALVIVQASGQDCGVYGCTIRNEYGTDTTDFLLSTDILSEILLKDDLEVGEEIEMTPLLFSKGLADSGCWGEKFFGRIITTEVCVGQGCRHKASRVKAIYGLDPVFESGSTCIVKVRSPIAYGTKQENSLSERNREITKQECKIQNMIREYCKIFAAEARVVDNFGVSLEVVPQYLMYRPANSVPYATVESDLGSGVLRYCTVDASGQMVSRTSTELEQKSSTFQHWIHQWTHGNLLVTQMEGVGGKITNVRAVSKSKGYQGLTESGSPKVFDHFLVQHQCNYYCGLLGLRPLKTMDSLQQPPKGKGSRSPLLGRKLGSGSSSPQLGRKMGPASSSPQAARRSASSPKVTRKGPDPQDPEAKAQETG